MTQQEKQHIIFNLSRLLNERLKDKSLSALMSSDNKIHVYKGEDEVAKIEILPGNRDNFFIALEDKLNLYETELFRL